MGITQVQFNLKFQSQKQISPFQLFSLIFISYPYLIIVMPIKFGYWGVRGAGHVSRLLLAYTEADFELVNYTTHEKWYQQDKKNLNLDFPNLPYLIDGDFKITESSAINRYIINRSGNKELLGRNASDAATIQIVEGVLKDAFKGIQALFWDKEHEKVKAEKLEAARAKLDYLNKFIGDKQFVLGYLTLVDFMIADKSDYFRALYPEECAKYPFFQRINRNLHSIPLEFLKKYSFHFLIQQNYANISKKYFNNSENPQAQHYQFSKFLVLIRIENAIQTEINFQEKIYTVKEDWIDKDKKELGLDFPNLPYLITMNRRLTESNAIYHYIASIFGKKELLGIDAKETTQIDQIIGVLGDIWDILIKLYTNPKHEEARKEVLEKLSPKLTQIEAFTAKKDFLFGKLTLPDFMLSEQSYYIEKVFPEEVKQQWPSLLQIRANVESLPAVKAYYAREGAISKPFLPNTPHIHIQL